MWWVLWLTNVGHSQYKIIQPSGYNLTFKIYSSCIPFLHISVMCILFFIRKILLVRFCIHYKKKMEINDKFSINSHIITFEIWYWVGNNVYGKQNADSLLAFSEACWRVQTKLPILCASLRCTESNSRIVTLCF